MFLAHLKSASHVNSARHPHVNGAPVVCRCNGYSLGEHTHYSVQTHFQLSSYRDSKLYDGPKLIKALSSTVKECLQQNTWSIHMKLYLFRVFDPIRYVGNICFKPSFREINSDFEQIELSYSIDY